MKLRTIIGLLFALIIVIFSIQNAEVIDVKFFVWKLSMSRVLIILGSFGIGVLVGYLLLLRQKINSKK
ncbi:lipopolysaccharide assembly protein LapA domain-containing protein [Mariniflexile soesokkakense]|uniref:Lipopolysaccharide assembly protein LapA domain-containing protein n=1 Tax=Mariniflexile soesokkakense TaxID=1343160 RepID=A0ABV0AAX3_9FLAO